MQLIDQQFKALINDILTAGKRKDTRNGEVLSLFVPDTITIDLSRAYKKDGRLVVPYPLSELRPLPQKHAITEQLWVMRGETNTEFLKEHDVNYWDPWADEDGELGLVYGAQMRGRGNTGGVDQLYNSIKLLLHDRGSRRNVITLWNPNDLDHMALPPCHGTLIQLSVQGEELHMHTHQRSCDVLVGLPMNVCQYTVMLALLAEVTGLKPGKLTIQLGDAHIYLNQHYYAQKLATTSPPHSGDRQPTLTLPAYPVGDDSMPGTRLSWIESLTKDDFEVNSYTPTRRKQKLKIPVSL